MSNQNYQDAILWIGQSYAKILCDKSRESCYSGGQPIPRRCYVHEVETRGCCRKVPKAPDWLVPGQSRIFLAHRGGQKDRSRGCIFGYFVLKRFELIVDEETYLAITDKDQIPWIETTFREIKQAVLDEVKEKESDEPPEKHEKDLPHMVHEQFDKRWPREFKRRIEKGTGISSQQRPRQPDSSSTSRSPQVEQQQYDLLAELVEELADNLVDELAEELVNNLVEELIEEAVTRSPEGDTMFQEQRAPDNSLPKPDTEKLLDKARQERKDRLSDKARKECKDKLSDKAREQLAKLRSKDQTHRQIETQVKMLIRKSRETPGGQAVRVTNVQVVNVRAMERETHRSCSKRLKPGSTYLVDALTAEITDTFMRNLERQTPATITQDEELFERTVRDVGKTHKKDTLTTIYPGLEDHVVLYGELLLFKEPYPVFERKPKAAFRSPLRVDGDRLLKEICASYKSTQAGGVPSIPYWGKDEGSWSAARLAEKFGFTKAYASALWRLYGDALEELGKHPEPGKCLDLPRIGKFTIENNELCFTPSE